MNILQYGEKLWSSKSSLVGGDGFLKSYLNQTSLNEVLTTLDISKRDYTILMLHKDRV